MRGWSGTVEGEVSILGCVSRDLVWPALIGPPRGAACPRRLQASLGTVPFRRVLLHADLVLYRRRFAEVSPIAQGEWRLNSI